ncbi:helix-turn-helix domain-containing protein [Halorubrum sp. ASP121]|uniref:helix-turn-helix domain-containing protein n=1 Tax=Halorubrum sp. ASP121 TaxID=1855858 RepID=UPI0018EEB438|nr:helix-turn-helix domain-containing protein [Halorubrum sp. ASP121]
MYYAYKYRLKPSDAHRKELDRHRDICRQLYNHTRYRGRVKFGVNCGRRRRLRASFELSLARHC